MPQKAFQFDFQKASESIIQPTITIGYYNLRGKAQVPRLLCEFLNIDYRDQLYTLSEWDKFKKLKAKNWDFPDLPYLKEGDFVISQPTPMCIYLINRFGKPELLGKTLNDKTLVSMYIWTIQAMANVISINCQKKTSQELKQFKRNQWKNSVAPRLKKYEEIAKNGDWFLGYFTLIDLSIYELVQYMELIFPGQMDDFPKLLAINQRVADIPQIKKYEISARAIRQTDPTSLLEEFKKFKSLQESKNRSLHSDKKEKR